MNVNVPSALCCTTLGCPSALLSGGVKSINPEAAPDFLLFMLRCLYRC